MMPGAHRVPLALLLPFMVGGCFGIGQTQVEAPSVELDRVIVRSVTTAGAGLELVLRVHNPNRFALRGAYVRLGIAVGGVEFGEVQADEPFHLPARESSDLVLPLRVEWAALGAAAREVLREERVAYAIRGRVGVEAGGTRLAIPVAREGMVPLLGSGS